MTTTLIEPAAAAAVPSLTRGELDGMTSQQLRHELARSLTMTAGHLRRLAGIWQELERRGEDLSDLRTGLAVYLPQIAAGQLTADAVIRFAGQPSVLRAIATLPPDDQQRLAEGASVPVLVAGDDGTYTQVDLPAHTLTPSLARLVIGPGGLRTPEQQRAIIADARLAAARRRSPDRTRVRYDRRTDRIRVGAASASVGEVVAALAQAGAVPDPDVETAVQVVVRLTDAERRVINVRAAQAGMTQQDYCRMLLVMQSVVQ